MHYMTIEIITQQAENIIEKNTQYPSQTSAS